MEYKCRNCNTCVYFPCAYYNQFNVDRNAGCIYWSDEIAHNYVSSGVNYDKTNLTVDTQYEKLPILKEENGKFYVAEEGIDQYGERYGYWLPISKELYLFLKNKGVK